jgi:hypothetical protein
MIGWAERVVAVEHDEQTWKSGVRMSAVSCLIQHLYLSTVTFALQPFSAGHREHGQGKRGKERL